MIKNYFLKSQKKTLKGNGIDRGTDYKEKNIINQFADDFVPSPCHLFFSKKEKEKAKTTLSLFSSSGFDTSCTKAD